VSELYVGLMSGTSLDGVDAVLADFSSLRLQVLGAASSELPAPLRQELLRLNQSGSDELHRAALAANALSEIYARLTLQLLQQCGVCASQVRAIGAHGQTVRHQPQAFDGIGYTLQLNQPALLAERTGIDVVADFRSRDVAAGGQGAPLVPPFHQAFFGHLDGVTGVLNIGGISNLTVLRAQAPDTLLGFDCGPGNALMDSWCQTHTGAPYDAQGAWAASGQVNAQLLKQLLSDPYFAKAAPKSTGRDLFNEAWLTRMRQGFDNLAPQHVQTTLTELTARACADSVRMLVPQCQRLIVCGGGAFNRYLMQRLQLLLPECTVGDSSQHGLPPLQVEASAFAWLARQCVLRQTGSVESVTGARGARILGAIYPR
jgi:anhydro-N-acetylmuramic acid kinase